MKKPIFNLEQRNKIRENNSLNSSMLNFDLAKRKLEREIRKITSPTIAAVLNWICDILKPTK